MRNITQSNATEVHSLYSIYTLTNSNSIINIKIIVSLLYIITLVSLGVINLPISLMYKSPFI